MASIFGGKRLLSAALVSALASGACSTSSGGKKGPTVTPAPEGEPWKTLEEWHLFADAPAQKPQDRVVPYDVIAQLFADYANKRRFLYVPDGEHIGYHATDVWDLPVGSIFVKTFSFFADARDPSKGERLLETRLLIHETAGWRPHTYVWNAEETEATLLRGGSTVPSEFIDPSGNPRTDNYVIPSESTCRECHGKLGLTDTLGGRTRQLDRTFDYGSGPENQIDHMAALGFFSETPEPAASRTHVVDPMDTAQPLDLRARSYFEGNCAHCHRPGDWNASLSGLWLDFESTDPSQSSINWGVCKHPAAAGGGTCGYSLDVVPGQPDQSIMTCRMESESGVGNVKMPPVGRNLVDAEGAALIRQWILDMPGSCTADPGTDGGALADAATD